MPTFIVWSCGAVRADLIERVDIDDQGVATLRLGAVTVVIVPKPDVTTVLNQLRGFAS